MVLPSCILQIGVGVTRRTSIYIEVECTSPCCPGFNVSLLDPSCTGRMFVSILWWPLEAAAALPVVVSGVLFTTQCTSKTPFSTFWSPSSSSYDALLENTLLWTKTHDKYLWVFLMIFTFSSNRKSVWRTLTNGSLLWMRMQSMQTVCIASNTLIYELRIWSSGWWCFRAGKV